MSAAVAKLEPQTMQLAPVSETTAIIHMIERVARDPQADIAKVRELVALRKEMIADEAKRAYDAALAIMQPLLPVIGRRGKIEVREKDKQTGERTGKLQQSTGYALWEDINEGIRPVLAQHGFALSFRVGQATDGKITITGILSHSGGHREETTITLMHDSTGSKNSVQAVGSSVSYGKRYTASALLNITSRGEDDDGKAAGAGETVSAQQIDAIRSAIVEVGADIAKFCRFMKVEKIEDIPAARYADAIAALNNKRSAS